jgi:large subunit ribosomal protein L11
MSKAIKTKIKLQLPSGSANPASVGSMLGPHGVNLMKFCTDFNNATKDKKGDVCPIVLTVYVDKTYEIEYKTPPASALIKKYSKIEKGSSKVQKGGKNPIGFITKANVMEIAKIKMQDLNTMDFDSACRSVEGSARSMGVEVRS